MTYSLELAIVGDDSAPVTTWVLDNVETLDEANAAADEVLQRQEDATGIVPERLDD